MQNDGVGRCLQGAEEASAEGTLAQAEVYSNRMRS